MDDTWFEIPELVAQVRELVPGAFVKATYSAGPSHLEQTGSPASIWIGIFNSSLNDGPLAAMEALAVEVAPTAVAWLTAHDLARDETGVMIAFGDGSEEPVMSWSNTLETVRYVIGRDKALTRIQSDLSEADEEFFREMRYRGSGRDTPSAKRRTASRESPRLDELQCRIIATRETGSPLWSFHLVNDGATAIESAHLEAVKYEWGDQYRGGKSPGVSVADLAPGDRAMIWRDDGSSEMRTDLWLRVQQHGLETWLLFEFPKLYRQQGTTLIAHPTRMAGPPQDGP